MSTVAEFSQAYARGYGGQPSTGLTGHAKLAHGLGRDDKKVGRPRRGAADLIDAAQRLKADQAQQEQAAAQKAAADQAAADKAAAQKATADQAAADKATADQARRAKVTGAVTSTAAKPADALARTVGFRGGDGGGLMLALVLYPLGLAVVKHGPAGIPLWFKAKFLNQVPTERA